MNQEMLPQQMMNAFEFSGCEVRVFMDVNGKPWFAAKDVCTSLEIQWQGAGKTLANMPPQWVMVGNLPTTQGERDSYLLAEPAIYRLAFRSNKPEAERFTNWVCEEVLPSIRQTGFYGRVEPRTRVVISKQVSALVAELVGCRNLMQQEYLIGEIRDLCNMIGKPMPDMTKLHTEIDQRSLPLGGGAA